MNSADLLNESTRYVVCRTLTKSDKVWLQPLKTYPSQEAAQTAAQKYAQRYAATFTVVLMLSSAQYVSQVVVVCNRKRRTRSDKGVRWSGEKRKHAAQRAANARKQREIKLSEYTAVLEQPTPRKKPQSR